jgi:hypothetical protein
VRTPAQAPRANAFAEVDTHRPPGVPRPHPHRQGTALLSARSTSTSPTTTEKSATPEPESAPTRLRPRCGRRTRAAIRWRRVRGGVINEYHRAACPPSRKRSSRPPTLDLARYRSSLALRGFATWYIATAGQHPGRSSSPYESSQLHLDLVPVRHDRGPHRPYEGSQRQGVQPDVGDRVTESSSALRGCYPDRPEPDGTKTSVRSTI